MHRGPSVPLAAGALFALSAGMLAHCSSSGSSSSGGSGGSWGTASVTGTTPIATGLVIADTNGYDAGPPPKINIELVEDRGQFSGVPSCHLYGSHGDLLGISVYLDFSSGSGAPLAAGSYPIVSCASCDAGAHASLHISDWENANGGYVGTSLAAGVSGTATLTRLDTLVAGTFEAQIQGADGGGSLSGTFSGPLCIKQY